MTQDPREQDTIGPRRTRATSDEFTHRETIRVADEQENMLEQDREEGPDTFTFAVEPDDYIGMILFRRIARDGTAYYERFTFGPGHWRIQKAEGPPGS